MRVAVLGAGYAGITVARRLERSLPEAADIVVVDESTDHLVQHELHRLVRYPDLTDAITVPLEKILSRAEIRQATVTDVDAEAGVATLDGAADLEYDFAAVCLGAETAFYGLDGVEEYATPLKAVEDAEAIREDALDAPGGSAVVGGGGLSGIQTAGELAALSAEEELALEITVVEMADRLAPGFDEAFADAIRRELEARDVVVETGVAVESADEATVYLEDGRSLPADAFVWTGGIRGPDAIGGERRATPRDLRVSDSTFVVGDAAAVTDENGVAVPASAQTAVRQARVAAANIARLAGDSAGPVRIPVADEHGEAEDADGDPESGGDTLSAYTPETAGWVVSVGDGAVAEVGPVVFSGDLAKAAKAAVGVGHLGSVGAIRQASELVAEELGWPTADALGLADQFEGESVDRLPTDPASPGALGDPLVSLLTGFEDALASPETIDLTAVTRPTDRAFPGSAMNRVQRTVFDSVGALLGTGGSGDHGDSTASTAVEIDVASEADTDDEQSDGEEVHVETAEEKADGDEAVAGDADSEAEADADADPDEGANDDADSGEEADDQ
jgi:NADH dehydrogenase